MIKILQIGDICGIPQALAAEQRRRGHEADSISFPRDYSIPARLSKFWKLLQIVLRYDRLHFHYSTGLPFALDLLLWKLQGKEIVMHFHGDDIRGKN